MSPPSIDTADHRPPPAPAFVEHPTSAFAGRAAELEKLTGHADSVRRARLRVAWLTAEAGVGKSTLAQAFVAQ